GGRSLVPFGTAVRLVQAARDPGLRRCGVALLPAARLDLHLGAGVVALATLADVGPAATEQAVVTGSALERVVATDAAEHVVAATALEGVVAAEPGQGVVAALADEQEVDRRAAAEGATGDRVVERRADDDLDPVVEGVVTFAGREPEAEVHGHLLRGAREADPVRSGVTEVGVVTRLTEQRVVARLTVQEVVPVACVDLVAVVVAVQAVVERAADHVLQV